jgi:hypothetical protein
VSRGKVMMRMRRAGILILMLKDIRFSSPQNYKSQIRNLKQIPNHKLQCSNYTAEPAAAKQGRH